MIITSRPHAKNEIKENTDAKWEAKALFCYGGNETTGIGQHSFDSPYINCKGLTYAQIKRWQRVHRVKPLALDNTGRPFALMRSYLPPPSMHGLGVSTH